MNRVLEHGTSAFFSSVVEIVEEMLNIKDSLAEVRMTTTVRDSVRVTVLFLVANESLAQPPKGGGLGCFGFPTSNQSGGLGRSYLENASLPLVARWLDC